MPRKRKVKKKKKEEENKKRKTCITLTKEGKKRTTNRSIPRK